MNATPRPAARLSLLGLVAILWLPVAASAQTTQYTYDAMRRLTRALYPDGSSIDYAYDNMGNRLMRVVTLPGAPANHTPSIVSPVGIADGATEVSNSPTVSWSAAADEDSNDAVYYTLYFGATPDPPLAYTGWDTNWSPGHLQCYSTYYWRVVARDSREAQSTSPVWSFTTSNEPPAVAFSGFPLSGTAPLTVQFQDLSTYQCGAMTAWEWDFDNNGTVDSTSRNPSHTFPVTPGDYTVRLAVRDEHGGTGTLVQTNFVSVLGNNIVDLAALTLNVEAAGSFRNLVVSYSVTNRGTILISGKWQWADTVYISTKDYYDTTATKVATFYENRSLLPGTVYAHTNLVPIPNLPLDDYYLILKADGPGQIGEINENNNVLVVPLSGRLPDLVPASLACSGPAIAGQPLDVFFTVTNYGALPLQDPAGTAVEWVDAVYLSTNAVWNSQAVFLGVEGLNQTLAAGAGYAVTNSAWVPACPPGNYYLMVRANAFDQILETDTANNVLTIPLTVLAPDLRPVSLTPPNGVPSDQTVFIDYAVTNQSNVPVQGFWADELYLSTNAVWDAQDYLVGTRYETGPLPGATNYLAACSARLPGWPAGSYYLILKVNAHQYLSESAIDNNELVVPFVLSAPAGLPDLSPISLTAPSTALAGQAVQVIYTITNSGPMGATGPWFDGIWISADPVLDSGDELLDFVVGASTLPAHGSYTRTNEVNLPLLDPGLYYLFVRANDMNQLHESIETNNVLSAMITVEPSAGLADLVPVSLSAPAAAAPGQTISVTYTVANQGLMPATGSWTDLILLSTDPFDLSGAQFLASQSPAGPVPVGANYVRTVNVQLPMVPPGSFYLILEANVATGLQESDLDNNTLAEPIELQGQTTSSDLMPFALVAPTAAAPGQTITVSYAVTNSGSVPALGVWYDFLVLSTNSLFEEADYMLAFGARTEAVAAGGTYRVTNTVSLPFWVPGNYYLLLNVNAFNLLGESVTNNNILSALLSLGSAPVVPWLGPARFLPDSTFQLSMTGALGANYTLQASTNLAQWVRVLDLSCTGTPTYIVDPNAGGFPMRAYRLAPFIPGAPPGPLLLPPAPRTTNLIIPAATPPRD